MIFDTNSLFIIVQAGHQEILVNAQSSTLIHYELGNAIWKKVHLSKTLSIKEGTLLIQYFEKILAKMNLISSETDETLKFAHEYGITFYDASYAYLAYRIHLPLVTDDKKLKDKVSSFIKTFSANDLF